MLVSVVQLSDLVMCDKSLQLCSTLFDPMDCSLPGYLCSWGFSRQGYWRGLPSPLPEDLCNPGIEPRSPALQVDPLTSEPLGKPKNTRVGSLSLLQGIFPIQESNQGILYCTQILYHLSHQGSPTCLRELVWINEWMDMSLMLLSAIITLSHLILILFW